MRVLSASFDVFPGVKGACTHINAFAQALALEFQEVHLVTIQNNNGEWLEESKRVVAELSEQGILHHGFQCVGRNVIDRALSYRRHFRAWLRTAGSFDAVHVRSIFEGYPIAKRKDEFCRFFVFECNGLPSIELKYHYPKVAEDDELLIKLRHQETYCMQQADLIVTPSTVTKEYLISLGIDADKIQVIPNGVDLDVFTYAPAVLPSSRNESLKLLYSGTMTSWQGVNVAIDALRLLRRDLRAELLLVGPTKKSQRKKLEQYIFEQELSNYVTLMPPVKQTDLVGLHHQADVFLAPLPSNDRNVVQGCCPLKILEGMACGIPIVATDLAVVRELAQADEDIIMVKPNSAKAIKDGILKICHEPRLATSISVSARKKIEDQFQWKHAQEHLRTCYRTLLSR
ncbi:MAG: glycosyltransferase family 4 protein [Myxococcota bacterium]|nr:glycosyltransferase family 4 protein [Myxococcota bacterium]